MTCKELRNSHSSSRNGKKRKEKLESTTLLISLKVLKSQDKPSPQTGERGEWKELSPSAEARPAAGQRARMASAASAGG